MNELSCRVVIGLVEMSERHGIAPQTLLAGHRHLPTHLMDGRNRTDWDIGIEVVRRMRESAGSREAFLMIPKLYSQTPGYGHIQKSAAAHFEPAHVFTHPNKVAVETAFGPGLKYSWRTVNAREIEVTYSTDATCPGTREFWESSFRRRRVSLVCRMRQWS